ncbi:MAG: pyruvate, orthophosphate dikinase [Gaiellaceae bacterium]|nr:pyruvate, orthophosphate dikinase [Gaiellaceae bacterium]
MSGVVERVLILDGSVPYDRDVVGGKGASLARMRSLGLPVPPAFVLPVDECRRYHAAGRLLDDTLWPSVREGIAVLEQETGRRFGDAEAPLLVSVRSGAPVSMPGMMDTILNLGIGDEVEEGLGRLCADAAFARNTHARFLREFGHMVMNADVERLPETATPAEIRTAILEDGGEAIPSDPYEQLEGAIRAVFDSWVSRRAVAYRRHWGIPEDGGTAVVVQAMVFGNLGPDSGTGVLFTRDPVTGRREMYGEWLSGGQGDDVVGGTVDPLPLAALAEQLPEAHVQLLDAARLLERENGDVQDIEFTVEERRLYLLQSRTAKRSAQAAVLTAVEFAEEGAIDKRTALQRVSPEQLAVVLAPRLSDEVRALAAVLARGTPACPGVASGRVVLDSDLAAAAKGSVILARPTTSPDDVSGIIAAHGVVTERGGSTSHAAVVTRALGRPSVVGVGEGITAEWEGAEVTVDGSAGVIYAHRLHTTEVHDDDVPGLATLVTWAREVSPVQVMDEATDVRDLDEHPARMDAEGRLDVEALAVKMRGAPAVTGSLLTTTDGARAVLRSGVTTVVRAPGQREAVVLLRLVQADGERDKEET